MYGKSSLSYNNHFFNKDMYLCNSQKMGLKNNHVKQCHENSKLESN